MELAAKASLCLCFMFYVLTPIFYLIFYLEEHILDLEEERKMFAWVKVFYHATKDLI